MKLRPIKANMTEIELTDGRRVLFSYQTPVALRVIDACGATFYRTSQRWSNTTTRHIKSWLPFDDAVIEDQSFFDALV
jgi:hypothetical protein